MKPSKIGAAALVALMLITGCSTAEKYNPLNRTAMNPNEIVYSFESTETYKNHIEIDGQWGANFATGINGQYGIGDPFIMRFCGKYYLYPSTSDHSAGIKVFQSDDLVNWQYMGFAVEPEESTTTSAYAPEVVYFKGSFYMCQSKGGSGHYIYKSSSPISGFTRITDNIGRGIDGAFHLGDDGKLYLLHTSTPAGLQYVEITNVDNIGASLNNSRDISMANLNGWIEGRAQSGAATTAI